MSRFHADVSKNGDVVLRPYTEQEEELADIREAEFAEYILQKEILDAILRIEETITERRKREAILSEYGREWLLERENEISELRSQL